jgi:predicted MPP superfamily phosphohydrolase
LSWRKKTGIGLLLFVAICAATIGYAFWIEPGRFVVHKEELRIPHWTGELTVAAIADLHIGSPHVDLNKLHTIVERTNAERPDLIVLLGDFVIGGPGGRREMRGSDGFVEPEPIAAELKNLHAPLGVFSVLGNHDHWYNGPRVKQALISVGIPVLRNSAVRLEHNGKPFWLGGVADLWTDAPYVKGTLAQTDPSEPVILITHNPDIFPEVPERVSLLIAAHTHGGQVNFPLIGTVITTSRLGYVSGHYQENGRHVFVTTGVGTSIIGARFRVPPEMALLHLLPQ